MVTNPSLSKRIGRLKRPSSPSCLSSRRAGKGSCRLRLQSALRLCYFSVLVAVQLATQVQEKANMAQEMLNAIGVEYEGANKYKIMAPGSPYPVRLDLHSPGHLKFSRRR